jgi:hypothetical protein
LNWYDAHLVQVMYWLDVVGQLLPLILTVAVVFTFFIVQAYGRKLERMSYYLDRIDNHLREITYFIKEYNRKEMQDKNGDGAEHEQGEDE